MRNLSSTRISNRIIPPSESLEGPFEAPSQPRRPHAPSAAGLRGSHLRRHGPPLLLFALLLLLVVVVLSPSSATRPAQRIHGFYCDFNKLCFRHIRRNNDCSAAWSAGIPPSAARPAQHANAHAHNKCKINDKNKKKKHDKFKVSQQKKHTKESTPAHRHPSIRARMHGCAWRAPVVPLIEAYIISGGGGGITSEILPTVDGHDGALEHGFVNDDNNKNKY